MSIITLSIIIGIDALLILGMLYILKNQQGTNLAVSDLTAEREMISGLQSSIKTEISKTTKEQKALMTKLSKIAAEIDHEVSSQKSGLGINLEEVTSELAQEFEKPLRELTQKQNALTNIYKQIEDERANLELAIAKAGQLVKFFNEKIPYDEIMAELEDKKYVDARRLLARGLSSEEVSIRIGLPIAEIEVLGDVGKF